MSKASDYRKRKMSTAPTAEITLPSGAVFTLRRPPLQVWVMAGKIPQSFLSQWLKGKAGAAETMSDEDTVAIILFVRDAITYACVSPKLVVNGTGEDELDPSEIDPADFEFLTQWVVQGSPGVPVQTKGGEVAKDDLAKFRQKRPGRGVASARIDGAEIREAAQ